MKDLDKFNIEVFKLSNNKHEYDFEVDSNFFKQFENSLVEEGKIHVHLFLDKRETLIEAIFNFSGSIELTCDRSLDLFDYPIDLDGKLIYKYGEEEMEVDDEIVIITKNTQRINVAQFIYETISLSIPYKKLHPKFAEDDDDENSTGSIIYQDEISDDTTEKEQENDNIDPRWEILKNLKNN
jgi:uncharacterized protein